MIYFIKSKRILIFEIILLILFSLVPLIWFEQKHIVVGLDSGYPVDFVGWFSQRVYTWLGSQNFGVDMSSEAGIVPYNMFPAIVSYLGASLYNVQKIVFIIWFFLISLSMYSLVRYFFPEPKHWIIRITAVIFYVFNLHLFSFWVQGEQPILSSYVILPLFTLILYRFIQKETTPFRTAIYLNLAYLFFGSGGMRGFPLIAPVMLVILILIIFFYAIRRKSEGFNYFSKFIPLSIYSLILFALCNAYFLLPFITSFSLQYSSQVTIAGGISGAIDWAKFISTHTSFLNVFRLQGDNNWYSNPHIYSNNYLENIFLIIGSFIFPIMAFSASFFVKVRRERIIVVFFMILSVVALFFSAGAHPPFGAIYVAMMEIIPGFAAFRSGFYKFIPAVYLSYSILIGISLYYICTRFRYKGILAVGFFILLLAYNFPYFQKGNSDFNKPFSTMVEIPEYVLQFAKMKNNSEDIGRTLVVPPPGIYSLKTYNWGYWSSYTLFPLITNRNFLLYDPILFNEDEAALALRPYRYLLDRNYEAFLRVARITGIRQILLTKDVVSDYQLAPTEKPGIYEDVLNNPEMFRVAWQQGEWTLYDIVQNDTFDKIHTAKSLTVSNGNVATLDNLFSTDINSFVFSSQVSSDLLAKLPVRSEIINYACSSCVILEDTSELSIQPSSLIPGSLGYVFKIDKEKKELTAVSDPSQRIDMLLGLSLKRTSEINLYDSTTVENKNRNDWVAATTLFSSYWDEIDTILSKQTSLMSNYSVLNKVSRYSDLQRKALQKAYVEKGLTQSDPISIAIANVLGRIEKVDSSVSEILERYNWQDDYIYDITDKSHSIRDITINPITLPRDLEDKPIMPYAYSLDDNLALISTNISVSEPALKNIDGRYSKLTLYFRDVPTLSPDTKVVKLNLLDRSRNCVYAPISNYKWHHTYIINATLNSSMIPSEVFVKRNYAIFKTADITLPDNNYFKPDVILSPTSEDGKSYEYQFTGKPNDTGASVYYCTDLTHTADSVFKDFTVREIVKPQLFSYIQKSDSSSVNVSSPIINFKKINSTHYVVEIQNAKEPYVLSFLEGFSPLWHLELEDKTGLENKHFMINGYANGWYINKSGHYVLHIKFKTQEAFENGVKITFISLLTIIGYLTFIIIKKIRSKK